MSARSCIGRVLTQGMQTVVIINNLRTTCQDMPGLSLLLHLVPDMSGISHASEVALCKTDLIRIHPHQWQ